MVRGADEFWTIDGWQSANVTTGVLELDRGDGSLQYNVLVDPVGLVSDCGGDYVRTLDFDYAVFYTVNGETYWDNNAGQDYYIFIE